MVWSETNAQGKISFLLIILKLYYFVTFLGLVPADSDTLFTVVHLPPNSGGGLFFGNVLDYPIPVGLDALLGQRYAGQLRYLSLQFGNKSAGAISGK